MKIKSLHVEGFLGIKKIHIDDPAPIIFVSGDNGAGKSSFLDAANLVLGSSIQRSDKKISTESLIHNNSRTVESVISVIADNKEINCVISNKGITRLGIVDGKYQDIVPFVINPSLFAQSRDKERKDLLLDIAGIGLDVQTYKAEMGKLGIDNKLIDKISPYLISGVEEAAKEAQSRARECKAAWRAVTGETYGSVKAEAWQSPNYNLDEINKELADLEPKSLAITAEINGLSNKSGGLAREKESNDRIKKQIEDAKPVLRMIPTLEEKIKAAEEHLSMLNSLLIEAKNRAHSLKEGDVVCKCPQCETELIFTDGKLIPHGDLRGDEDAAVSLNELQEKISTVQACLKNYKEDLTKANDLKNKIKSIREMLVEIKEDQLPEINAKITMLGRDKSAIDEEIKQLKVRKELALISSEKTQKAKQYHLEVIEWNRIAESLSPDGITLNLLNEAIKPINKRLEYTSRLSGWGRVTIDVETNITYGERPYALLSESEQWRTDFMIAEAISHTSQIKFVAADRFDVLDGNGRFHALTFLENISKAGEIDTAIICGTIKEDQAKSIASAFNNEVTVCWIKDGVGKQLSVPKAIKNEAIIA